MKPLLSIITVTRNAAATLPATLASVAAQTCDLYEHILVDGASTDATVSLALESGIRSMRIVSEPDKGLYDAMNKGLAMATGDYVVFLNAGDSFADADTLQTVADVIMDNDYPGVVYGQTRLVDASRRPVGERHLRAPEVLTMQSFADGMVVCHQAFFALRKITRPYDLRWRFSADYEWCIRCLQRSRRNVGIDRVLIDYLNEGMTTHNHRRSLMERFKIMCIYYGTVPTVLRHFGFAVRQLKRKFKS